MGEEFKELGSEAGTQPECEEKGYCIPGHCHHIYLHEPCNTWPLGL